MKKKILLAAAFVLFLGLLVSADHFGSDPNFILKHKTRKLSLDKTAEVQFKQSGAKKVGKHRIPVFTFKPDEDAEYSLTVSDIKTEDDIYITMSVCDQNLNDYITEDNYEDHADSISGSEFLSKDSKCYVIINAVTRSDSDPSCSGSFNVTVTRVSEDTETIELTESASVTVSMGEDELSPVMFRPVETGFYRFDTSVISDEEDAGYSYISKVTTDKKKEVENTEGISYLDEGKSYFIWVSASDITAKQADVSVSCIRVATIETDETGSYDISGPTLINFKAKDTANYAVYSVSDGDITGSVYDSEGFPMNKDTNSGGTLSGNKNDFALILQAKKGSSYIIYADGEFTRCSINIAVYTGDGTSLGLQDLETAHETGEGEGTEADNQEESEETQE